MKSIVIYDSHTGNTKKVAKAIHSGMSQSCEQCEIAPLRDVHGEDLGSYDLIGLGSPVIKLRELSNVTEFIEYSMASAEGKHSFAFCTHGALPGHYLSRVVPAMTQRGLTVIGWNDWFGSVFYPVVPKPYFTDGHPDETDLKEAEDFGREMVGRSQMISLGETQLIPNFPKGKDYDQLYFAPETYNDKKVKRLRAEFHRIRALTELKINREKCKNPKCTLCIDNCPVGAIDFFVSPPVITRKCEECYLCEQACPNGAIEVDWEPFQKAHDPLVTHSLQKTLEVFEARGYFRRLVPLEDVGWNTPFWHRKHPRIKIE